MTYAGAQYWDQYFLRLRESGHALDWEGQWTEPFLAPLRAAEAHCVLELGTGTGTGTGTGNDAAWHPASVACVVPLPHAVVR